MRVQIEMCGGGVFPQPSLRYGGHAYFSFVTRSQAWRCSYHATWYRELQTQDFAWWLPDLCIILRCRGVFLDISPSIPKEWWLLCPCHQLKSNSNKGVTTQWSLPGCTSLPGCRASRWRTGKRPGWKWLQGPGTCCGLPLDTLLVQG